MINAVVPETKVPSHQGPDAQTVIPDFDITTMAGAGPYNASHIHFAMVATTRPVSIRELRTALRAEPRVAFVLESDGLVAFGSVIELVRDLGRPHGDRWGVATRGNALAAYAVELFPTYQVHNKSIVVPETIDCIRALSGVERDGAASIAKTDASLGITTQLLSPLAEATGARADAWRSEPAHVAGKEQS